MIDHTVDSGPYLSLESGNQRKRIPCGSAEPSNRSFQVDVVVQPGLSHSPSLLQVFRLFRTDFF